MGASFCVGAVAGATLLWDLAYLVGGGQEGKRAVCVLDERRGEEKRKRSVLDGWNRTISILYSLPTLCMSILLMRPCASVSEYVLSQVIKV